LLGAITNQGGITSDEVGKVEVRESHSIVEVAPAAVDGVIERVTGTTIRGRRAVVRRDEQRAPRDNDRGPRRADRGGRERTPPRRGDRK
jgi:ATP-dependent RNA helicase DeaD